MESRNFSQVVGAVTKRDGREGGVVVRPIANLPQNVTRSRRAGARDAGSVGCNFEMGSKVVEDLVEFSNALPRLCLFLAFFVFLRRAILRKERKERAIFVTALRGVLGVIPLTR